MKYLEHAINKIDTTLKTALTKQEISSNEYKAMCTTDKEPGKFYQLFKFHKSHTPLTYQRVDP
jgi:hypothetical protein